MATKYPADDPSAEFVTLDLVKWQKYVLTDNSLKITDYDQSPSLPDISIFLHDLEEEDIFFVSNLTMKELNKPIVIHWGKRLFPQEEIITKEREGLQILDMGNIHVEFDLKGFIMLHPMTFKELEKIYNMLKVANTYYMDDEPGIVDLLFTLSQVNESILLFKTQTLYACNIY